MWRALFCRQFLEQLLHFFVFTPRGPAKVEQLSRDLLFNRKVENTPLTITHSVTSHAHLLSRVVSSRELV